MYKPRDKDDFAMLPIMIGVLGFVLLLGIAGQLIAQAVTHDVPAVSGPAAPAAPAAEKKDPAPETKAAALAPAPAPPAATPPAPAAAEPAPAPTLPPVAAVPEAPTPPPATAPAAPAAAPAAATTAALTKLALAGGASIDAAGNGVESQLLGFINDAAAVVDKGKWFDFDRLNFETGSARLTADSKAQVDNIAAILKAFPNVKIKIGGYTDNTGNADANLKLSGERAKAVVDALTGLGIAADRLESEGYGDQHAIADNATPEGRAKNRRIAVSVRAK